MDIDIDIRRVTVVREAGYVAAMVVDQCDGLRVEVGPVQAMRQMAIDLAAQHHLVQAQPDVWERRGRIVLG
jgi:hypothetical protein